MTTGRVLYAGLRLLDRQLVDRHGAMCGKVDDLELTADPATGRLYVAAVLTGPGALLQRLGRRRLGGWLRQFAGEGGRIPFSRVSDVGDHVTLALDADEVATHKGERWAGDHVLAHIPGSGHDADR